MLGERRTRAVFVLVFARLFLQVYEAKEKLSLMDFRILLLPLLIPFRPLPSPRAFCSLHCYLLSELVQLSATCCIFI